MQYGLNNWRTVALLVAALILSACAGTDKNAWVELRSGPATDRPIVQINGTVVRSDLEGGLYLLRGAEGTNYNPTNLPDAFRVDGQAIEATAQRRDDLVSIGMVGVIVDLLRIRARSEGMPSIAGTVSYRERVALPPDAVVEVQLLDVSRQDAPSIIIAAASFPTRDRQVPIPFTLSYDPSKIIEKHSYAVRAVIRSEGTVIFMSTSRYSVITHGNLSRADLMLMRVGRTNAGTDVLVGTAWSLEDLGGAGVMDRVPATLVFSADGAVTGTASCNQFHSTVTVLTGSVTFNPLATTRKMCAEAVMHQEARYVEALRAADRFEVKGEFLSIHAAGRPQPLRFISKRDQ